MLKRIASLAVLLALAAAIAFAQQTTGALRGQVADESGAVIPGASVVVTSTSGAKRSVKANEYGSFVVPGLPSGVYTVEVTASGMAPYQVNGVNVAVGGAQTLNIQLKLGSTKQEVTVKETSAPTVSVDPSANAGALVLKGEDIEALSDDPDEMEEDLLALAGPAAGPNGGQIFIDGFTGGRLPPKESIREIRINQNPFSAEYDRIGFGRIEILTRPGSDKYHGQASFNFSDTSMNSRNPFLLTKPPYQTKDLSGHLSGPVTKKSSFFIDLDRRATNDVAAVNATTVDPATFTFLPFRQAIQSPSTRYSISPRFDYQLSQNNTLVLRYSFTDSGHKNSGLSTLTLPDLGYNRETTQHTLNVTETAVFGAKVNETRFQFSRDDSSSTALTNQPGVIVSGAFSGGGAQVGQSFTNSHRYEIQNYTSMIKGTHSLRAGVRLRATGENDDAPTNFAGRFTFASAFGPLLDANNQPTGATGQITAVEGYRRTLLFQSLNYLPAQIRALGGGASQFSIAGGNPLASINQADVGLFAQDDWRIRPNLTLSLGLRWETQTNISDYRDFAPRVGVAWAPGTKGKTPSKTVFRGGFGFFYDRLSEGVTLNSQRYNGINQKQYIVKNPDFFPTVPTVAQLTALARPSTIDTIDPNLHVPYLMQTALAVERQLPFASTLSVTFVSSRGRHTLLTRNINAPYPGSAILPSPDFGQITQYEAAGVSSQRQIITSVNTRVGSKLTLSTTYSNNNAHNNTDGGFPANTYNLASDYGRSNYDNHHFVSVIASYSAKWSIRLSPYMIYSSGRPFNITTGTDVNGDNIFNDRPSYATAQSPAINVRNTAWGTFNLVPLPGEVMVPRNQGDGPSSMTINARISKTFGFGPERDPSYRPSSGSGGDHGDHGSHSHGGSSRGSGGFGGSSRGSSRSSDSTSRRYNLNLSLSARNLMNHTNLGPYQGSLNSPNFGNALSLGGSSYGYGSGGAANNRRLEASLRFTF